MSEHKLSPQELVVRAHDVVACMERLRSVEFDFVQTLGLAVRLALHLRGAQPVTYGLLRKVAVHLLDFTPAEVKPALALLAEVEFVILHTQGQTIKTVIPNVPYFDDLYSTLGSFAQTQQLTEAEQLTILLTSRLAQSPMLRAQVNALGAEHQLVKRVVKIGSDGGFIIQRRARGRDVLISPSYFPESGDAFADLVAGRGAERVKRILTLLQKHQGWPLTKILSESVLGATPLTADEIAILQALAGEGFVPPPAIKTSHHGLNHFLFGPRPGQGRLPITKKAIYERAMALVAAVRQGQFLAKEYAIRDPEALLTALRDKGFIRSSTEAFEQYRQIAFLGIARLVPVAQQWHKLELVQNPENLEALEMAITLVRGSQVLAAPDEEVIIALRRGESYVESLIGRRLLAMHQVVELDQESRDEIDTLVYGGIK